MSKLYSPLATKSDKIKLVAVFQTNQIIKNYALLGIDVTRFFKETEIKLFKCNKTGYRFFYPFSSIGDALFYEELSKNRKNYYSRRWEHSEALNYINNSDLVLEIGSGFGSFLSLLKENKIVSKGLELNPYAVEKCNNEGLNVEEKLIQDEAKINKKQYDVVCSFQVLEHIVDVNSFIKSSIETIKNGGKLIVGVPNNNPYLFINDKFHTLNIPPHHAGLWNKEALKSLENLFPIKLEKLIFEPLSGNYSYFIDSYMNNLKNKFMKKAIVVIHRFMPKALKILICTFVNGRNVIAIYKKIG
jgi:SAM-dependent methyltransferase